MPSIPTPTIPQRTRSLPAIEVVDENIGSEFRSMAFPARVAHAGPAVECNGNVPAFAGVQSNLLESLQLLHRPCYAGVRFTYVHFGNLGAGTMPGIGHVKANADRLNACGMPGNDGKILVGERGVR